jgi:hypothetical protein
MWQRPWVEDVSRISHIACPRDPVAAGRHSVEENDNENPVAFNFV